MQRWYGKLLGFIAGAALFRGQPALGALLGLLIGHAIDAGWFKTPISTSPYRVLGLTEQATDAEIELAYRRLMTQYHPDKVAGQSEETRQRAETKARAINAAYDRIRELRGQ